MEAKKKAQFPEKILSMLSKICVGICLFSILLSSEPGSYFQSYLIFTEVKEVSLLSSVSVDSQAMWENLRDLQLVIMVFPPFGNLFQNVSIEVYIPL